MTVGGSTGAIWFRSSAATPQKFYMAGKSWPNNLKVTQEGGTLQFAEEVKGPWCQVLVGTLDTNGQTMDIGEFELMGITNAEQAQVREVKFSTSLVRIKNTSGPVCVLWPSTPGTGVTVSYGEATIELVGTGSSNKRITPGNQNLTIGTVVMASDNVSPLGIASENVTIKKLVLNNKGGTFGTTIHENATVTVTESITTNGTSAEPVKLMVIEEPTGEWHLKAPPGVILEPAYVELSGAKLEGGGQMIVRGIVKGKGDKGHNHGVAFEEELEQEFPHTMVHDLASRF
jgi:hypothetical protein